MQEVKIKLLNPVRQQKRQHNILMSNRLKTIEIIISFSYFKTCFSFNGQCELCIHLILVSSVRDKITAKLNVLYFYHLTLLAAEQQYLVLL